MRHPLRNLAGQGFWYTLSNVLFKLAGIVLIPLYTNSEYLSVREFGLWGVLEITVNISVAILGLQLGAGLIRFYPETERPAGMVSAVWWITVGVAAAAATAALGIIQMLAPAAERIVYVLVVVYIVEEMLLATPLALLRAQSRASRYLWLSVVKLSLIIGLNLLWLAHFRQGLTGLAASFAVASGVTLGAGVLLTGPGNYVSAPAGRKLVGALLRFSVPLILGGLGSMVLNAGDRYVLAYFRPEEDIALYTLATRFGGTVNMFGVQPLQLAFLPLLFQLAVSQRSEVLRLLMRYLVVGFGLLVVGLSLFTEPVLDLFGSDPFYDQSVILVPWIALGFALFGMSVLFDGVLTLFHRTATMSMWIAIAATANIALNLAVVPFLGPLGAAITTTLSYALLFAGRYFASRRYLQVPYGWGAMTGILLATALVSFGGALFSFPDGLAGWAARSLVVAGWCGVILVAGWFRLADIQALWQMRRSGAADAP